MPSLLNSELVSAPSLGSSTDAILSELSRQLASVNSRRLSRGSNGHKTPGSAMRITKPSSANNSPQSTILKSRRRTMMNDGFHGRLNLPHPIETSYLPTPNAEMAFDHINEPVKRAARPLSWHPSPQQVAPQQQQQPSLMQYPFPPYQETDIYSNFQQLPPTPAAYSGYNSPASATAFSPLSLPYSSLEQPPYVSPTPWAASGMSTQTHSTASSSLSSAEPLSAVPQQLPRLSGSSGSSSDWDSFVERGFDRCTAPPTPENFQQPAEPRAKLPAEDAIPFQPLEDEDEEGEILYGMGLYDAPENSQLDYHRSTVLSLLGPAESSSEPTGKGLKLEDAWEPPALDDDDEEDKDGDDDAEGEDQDD